MDLLGVLVSREDRIEHTLVLVGDVDGQRVVRDELRERVRDAIEQEVEALLAEDEVEDVGQPPIRVGVGPRAEPVRTERGCCVVRLRVHTSVTAGADRRRRVSDGVAA